MPTPDLPDSSKRELLQYLEQITQETKNGVLGWKSANPTTYTWENEAARARLVIQRFEHAPTADSDSADRSKKRFAYRFQAIEVGFPATVRLSINTAEEPDMLNVLERLFDTIVAALAQGALDFLKRAIDAKA